MREWPPVRLRHGLSPISVLLGWTDQSLIQVRCWVQCPREDLLVFGGELTVTCLPLRRDAISSGRPRVSFVFVFVHVRLSE